MSEIKKLENNTRWMENPSQEFLAFEFVSQAHIEAVAAEMDKRYRAVSELTHRAFMTRKGPERAALDEGFWKGRELLYFLRFIEEIQPDKYSYYSDRMPDPDILDLDLGLKYGYHSVEYPEPQEEHDMSQRLATLLNDLIVYEQDLSWQVDTIGMHI